MTTAYAQMCNLPATVRLELPGGGVVLPLKAKQGKRKDVALVGSSYVYVTLAGRLHRCRLTVRLSAPGSEAWEGAPKEIKK